MGTGQANTSAILTALDGQGYTNYAAKYCDNLEVTNNGSTYDDWFLPSKDELGLMYTNLHQQSQGGFAADSYWSSSEISGFNAWCQDFSSGTQESKFKGATSGYRRVRACRAFN